MRPSGLPTLSSLGDDLTVTGSGRRLVTLGRPFACAAVALAVSGHPALVVVAMVPLFLSVVVAAHDLVHGTLGLSRRAESVLLCLVGLIVLESGHAYRVSHLQHHRRWPRPGDDPEGDPARMPLWRALAEGPVFLPRLWWWAWRRRPDQRPWLALEAAAVPALASAGPLTGQPGLTLYAALCVAGSWTYPVATVHLPHRGDTLDPLRATRTLHGRVLPRLLLELSYHLEHHLYPAVPTHRYAELSRRLRPHLASLRGATDEFGVRGRSSGA